MTSDIANELPILPNPEHQNAEERARDEPRLQLLMRLQHIVKAKKITNYEDLRQATKAVEKEMAEEKKQKMAKRKSIKKVKAAAGTEKKKSVVKKVKTENMGEKAAKDAFPRLVRRNARRGLPVAEGQTWTEEVVMG
ncbi:unnamed protein product [Caenorhabditis brenneri]